MSYLAEINSNCQFELECQGICWGLGVNMWCFARFVIICTFKKHEKHPWRSVTFSKACNFTKSNGPLWVFFTFLKLFKWYQIAQSITCIQLKFLSFLSGTGEVNNILLECPLLVCRGIFTWILNAVSWL